MYPQKISYKEYEGESCFLKSKKSCDYKDVNCDEVIDIIFEENPILRELSLDNMIIAGGYITSTIQKLSGFLEEDTTKSCEFFKPESEKDIDIFMYEIDDEKAFQKIKELVDAGLKYDKETIFHRTTFAYTIESKNNLYRKIQIINNIYSSPLAVLKSFDLYSSQVGIHLKDQKMKLLTTERGLESLEYRIQVIDKDLENFHFDNRVVKYFNRGYNLVLPYLNPKSFSENEMFFIGFYISIYVTKIFESHIQADLYISYRSHTFKRPSSDDSCFYDCQNSRNYRSNYPIFYNSHYERIDEDFYRYSNGISSSTIENIYDFFRTLHHRKNFFCGYTLKEINSADEALQKIFDGRSGDIIDPFQNLDIFSSLKRILEDPDPNKFKNRTYDDVFYVKLMKKSYKSFNLKRFTRTDSIFANEKAIPISSWYRCELDIHEYITEFEKDILMKRFKYKRFCKSLSQDDLSCNFVSNMQSEKDFELSGSK